MPKSAGESAEGGAGHGTRTKHPSFARRVGWLVLIWVLSVLALAVVAGLMRLLMSSAGLTV